MTASYKRSQRSHNGSTAEFAPALLVLFVIMVFPLIDLLAVAVGYADAWVLSVRWASIAAGSTGIESGTSLVERDCTKSMQTGLANLVKLSVPDIRVYGVRTKVMDGSVEYIGPRERANPPLNTTDYVYEYMTKAQFEQQPFVTMGGLPGLQSVPGLGAPFKYTLSQMRAVEHLEGLIHDPIVASNEGDDISTADGDAVSDESDGFDAGDWKRGWPP
jgi:hypothetical protein